MPSELSPYAIHRILYLVENDDRPGRRVNKAPTPLDKRHPRNVNEKWRYVYSCYFDALPRTLRTRKSPPPMSYLRSLELALFLKEDLDNKDVRAIFGHGKSLAFDADLPRLLVPKIIEAFQRLKEEPSFLDVTLSEQSKVVFGPCPVAPVDLEAVWPRVYLDHLPCGACTTANEPAEAKKKNLELSNASSSNRRRQDFAEQERFLVEKFHIPSMHFNNQLTVELHFTLEDAGEYDDDDDGAVRPATAPALVKGDVRKVTVRLGNPPCTCSPCAMGRKSKSLLLLPEFASEVYGFLDRAHVGTSLLANRALNELVFKLRHLLPVHHLACTFASYFMGESCPKRVPGVYWLALGHFRRDLQYCDSRRFKLPSKDGAAAYCSLVRGYLSNSHLSDFKAPKSDAQFAFKMLAALADRNFSVGALRICADEGLSNYRTMDNVLNGGIRLATLELSLFENSFASLVKATDFFRMPTVQQLKALKLELEEPGRSKAKKPRRLAIASFPLWIAGIHLLRNCERFEVKYDSDRHLQATGIELVEFCEKFERGEISELVEHFKFATSRYVDFPFIDDKKIASGVEVGRYKWDVYRFRNAFTGDWLTACVGQEANQYRHRSMLHIVKGEVYPDASFAV